MESDDLPGTIRLIERFQSLSPNQHNAMRKSALRLLPKALCAGKCRAGSVQSAGADLMQVLFLLEESGVG